MQFHQSIKFQKDGNKLNNNAIYIQKKYNYKENINARSEIAKVVGANFLNKTVSDQEVNNDVLFSFATKEFTYTDYYKYLRSKARSYKNLAQASDVIENSFNDFVNTNVFAYQDENLENEYVDFATIMQEYREGLLLFDLMEKEVWNKAKSDSIGLRKYYDSNKLNYKWGERIFAVIATSSKKGTAKKVCKLLKKESVETVVDSKMEDLVVSEGIFEKNDKELPRNLKFEKGVSKIKKHNNQFVLVKVNEVLAPSVKSYEEVKGRVINDYQEQIEKEWISNLRKKYTVKINQSVLNEVKKQL